MIIRGAPVQRLNLSDSTVTSVNSLTGAVTLAAGTDISISNDIPSKTITTSSTGATGYVPYTGAIQDVDLGAHSLTAQGLITTTGFIQTSTASNASIAIGGANPFAATALNSISIANYTDYGVTPFVGHNNIIVGHDVAFNG